MYMHMLPPVFCFEGAKPAHESKENDGFTKNVSSCLRLTLVGGNAPPCWMITAESREEEEALTVNMAFSFGGATSNTAASKSLLI